MNRYIKAVGAGAKRARALDREEARAAMELIAAGRAQPEQVGAFLLALRMKGEVAGELAGFADALAPYASSLAAPADLLEVDAHGDGHADLPSLLLAAACAAAALGVPVCLGVERGSPFARHGLDGALAALGLTGRLDAARALRDLARSGVAACDLADSCPPLARLVALRPLFGVRTAAQTVAKLVSSFTPGPRRRLVGIFHAPYLESTAAALGLLGVENGLVVQALGGLPEARPGKMLRVAATAGGGARMLDFRPWEAADATENFPLDQADQAAEIPAPPGDAGPATIAALAGKPPFARRAAAAAGLLMHAATQVEPLLAARDALASLVDGRALAVAKRLH